MKATFVLCVLVGACAMEDPLPLDPEVPYTVPRTGEEEQGRHLLGSQADQLVSATGRYISISAPMAGWTLRVVSPTQIVLKNASGNSQTVVRTYTTAVTDLRIIAPTSTGYQLQYRDAGGNWPDYCDPGQDAIAMEGEWTIDGRHLAMPGVVTFACQESGKAAKCESWEYVPEIGGNEYSDTWKLHQACTRMARADYCGDGETHTEEETPIWIRDLVRGAAEPDIDANPLPVWSSASPPPPDKLYFESVWTSDGAICFSRLRWRSLPTDGFGCPNLIDPRRAHSTGTYCEDLDDHDATHLWNASLTMDLPLHTWRNTSNGEYLTTVRGYAYQDGSSTVVVAPTGYDSPPVVVLDNFLLRHETGDLTYDPTGVSGNLIPVFRQHMGTSDYVVAPDGALPGYTRATGSYPSWGADFEGYLITDPDAASDFGDLADFQLFTNGTDYVTATAAPSGYALPKPKTNLPTHLGWVIPSPMITH